MLNLLGGSISVESFLMVFIAVILISYFVYKEWPEFKRRISGSAKVEDNEKNLAERMGKVEDHLKQVDEKLKRDYDNINAIDDRAKRISEAAEESLEERKIIMQALLGVVQGLQEIGANGPTKDAEKMLTTYLNQMAHIDQGLLHK